MKLPMLFALTLILFSNPTFACGFCDGDALAGTYDYKLQKEIKEKGFELTGYRLRCLDDEKAIASQLEKFEGVMKNSVRFNCDVGIVSMGIDPAVTNTELIMNKFNEAKKLKSKLEDKSLGLKKGASNEKE